MEDAEKQKHALIERLVSSSQSGEADAFGKLYELFVAPIYRYMYYRVGREDAEDLTELVFLKTWENIHQYEKRQSSFSAWIFRIAHNVVVDHYRAHQANGELSENIEDKRRDASATERIHRRLDQEILTTAMKELKEHYRQVLILKYINGLSNEEIGNIMGKSQAALRILQFRALRTLRRVLQDQGISEEDM